MVHAVLLSIAKTRDVLTLTKKLPKSLLAWGEEETVEETEKNVAVGQKTVGKTANARRIKMRLMMKMKRNVQLTRNARKDHLQDQNV